MELTRHHVDVSTLVVELYSRGEKNDLIAALQSRCYLFEHTVHRRRCEVSGVPSARARLSILQAGRRHGWSLHNCILVIQFLTDRAENFLTKRLIIVRIKARKPIFDFQKKKIYCINIFRIFSKISKSRC